MLDCEPRVVRPEAAERQEEWPSRLADSQTHTNRECARNPLSTRSEIALRASERRTSRSRPSDRLRLHNGSALNGRPGARPSVASQGPFRPAGPFQPGRVRRRTLRINPCDSAGYLAPVAWREAE